MHKIGHMGYFAIKEKTIGKLKQRNIFNEWPQHIYSGMRVAH